MKPSVKVRGIYSTALTKLFKDSGFSIVEPSREISEKFTLEENFCLRPIEITDRPDRQGIIVKGDLEQSREVIEAIRANCFDAIVRTLPIDLPKKPSKEGMFPLQAFLGVICFEVEFPYLSKSILDQLRTNIAPTIANHHRFRIIATTEVDHAETLLLEYPERKKDIEAQLDRLIHDGFRPGEMIRIEHVKPEGQIIQLATGKIRDFDPRKSKVTIMRESFRPGRYDGLGIAKEEEDYAITEAGQGGWTVKHSYYSKANELKGEFYNINTPVEFYPDRLRYVDLHVDVVRWPDGKVKVVDIDLLEESVRHGYITQALKEKAEQVVQELVTNLKFKV